MRQRLGRYVMNWEAIGAIGDLVGGVAVIATLIYLALQVRQSKELLERNEKIALSQVYQSRADARMSLVLAQAESDKVELIASAWGHPDLVDGLENEDREIVRQYMIATIVHQDNILYQASLGLLGDSTMRGIKDLVGLNVPVWEKLDIELTPLIKECYAYNEDDGDA